VELLGQLVFTFDRPIDAGLLKRTGRQVLVAWWHPDGPMGAVLAVHGVAAADGTQLIWRVDTADANALKEQAGRGGRIVVDLNCDVVLDERGQPVSSSWTSIFAAPVPRPGGIMRTWIQVRAG
jgi:hypothetical protein